MSRIAKAIRLFAFFRSVLVSLDLSFATEEAIPEAEQAHTVERSKIKAIIKGKGSNVGEYLNGIGKYANDRSKITRKIALNLESRFWLKVRFSFLQWVK